MIHLADNHQDIIALIYNNILLVPNGKVIGVLLGHCVFGMDGQVKAKYFQHTLFTIEGNILAKAAESKKIFSIDIMQLVENAWLVIMKIKDHTCPVIVPTNEWTHLSLREHFYNVKMV